MRFWIPALLAILGSASVPSCQPARGGSVAELRAVQELSEQVVERALTLRRSGDSFDSLWSESRWFPGWRPPTVGEKLADETPLLIQSMAEWIRRRGAEGRWSFRAAAPGAAHQVVAVVPTGEELALRLSQAAGGWSLVQIDLLAKRPLIRDQSARTFAEGLLMQMLAIEGAFLSWSLGEGMRVPMSGRTQQRLLRAVWPGESWQLSPPGEPFDVGEAVVVHPYSWFNAYHDKLEFSTRQEIRWHELDRSADRHRFRVSIRSWRVEGEVPEVQRLALEVVRVDGQWCLSSFEDAGQPDGYFEFHLSPDGRRWEFQPPGD